MTPDDLERLRRRLLLKGKELSDLLVDLLNGKAPGALDLLTAEPGETDEEKLRRYLGLVQSRLDAIGAGTYGIDVRTGKEIPLVELLENPLADAARD